MLWQIRETHAITKRKTSDGEKYVNNYRVLHTIGTGRFARVKVCERLQPPQPPRRFAMKIYSTSALRRMKEYVSTHNSMRIVTALDRVQQEVEILRQLYHRNVALLFEVLWADDHDKIYLILELLEQGPCMQLVPSTRQFISPITRTSTLPDALVRSHVADILNGLAYLHDRRICHRDIKPDNLLLNATGRCHFIDFGCALQCDDLSTVVSDTVGTYQFLAPECCQAAPYNPFAADLWAVGIVMFIFLFGTLPFDAPNTKDLFEIIAQSDITAQVDTAAQATGRPLTPLCRDVLLQLLHRNPSERVRVHAAIVHPWLQEQQDQEEEEEPLSF